MAKKNTTACKGKTQKGSPCRRKASESGYCKLHDPARLKEKAQKLKELKQREKHLYDLINMVTKASRAKGWDAYLKSVDEDNCRYASLSVSRTESYQSVTALVEISCNSHISISTEQTSFHNYGLDSLRKAFRDGLDALPWTKPIDKKPKARQWGC
ncbi:MAG: DUF5763 domain-containing protein [Planctomycetota bacterium]|jgi:hypothetical protein